MVALVAGVAALLLLPHPVAGDERDELERTRRRLGAVEAVTGLAVVVQAADLRELLERAVTLG